MFLRGITLTRRWNCGLGSIPTIISKLILSQVVPSRSAILPGYIPIGIRSNHMDMTKFEDGDDPGFVAVAGELRRWCRELSSFSPGGACVTAIGQQGQPVHQGGPQCTCKKPLQSTEVNERTALRKIIRQGDADAVRAMPAYLDLDNTLLGGEDISAVSYAAHYGKIEVFKVLVLERGAKVDIPDPTGSSALFFEQSKAGPHCTSILCVSS